MPTLQHDRHFTHAEATELLPWLTPRLERISELLDELDNCGFDAVNNRWAPSGNGHAGGPPPEEYHELIRLIAEIDQAGVLLKNLKKGVVDFPHMRPDGDEAYLCWMVGEPGISYWHRIQEGFKGRIPIEDGYRA